MHCPVQPDLRHLCEPNGAVEGDATAVLALEINVGWLAVQSQTNRLQFVLQNLAVAVAGFLTGVQDHEDHVRRLGDGNDLSSATTAVGSTFNDTG